MKGKRVKLSKHLRKEIEKESLVGEKGLYLKSEKLFPIAHDADPPVILLRTIMDRDGGLSLFEVINLYEDDFERRILLFFDDLETWVPEVMKEFKSYMSRLKSRSVGQ